MKKINLAIVGATGLVGNMFLRVLEEKPNIIIHKLYLYASERSEGKKIIFRGKEILVEKLCIENIINRNIDYVLFSAGAKISQLFAEKFTEIGATIIDNSSAFRMNDFVPLIVPQVNMEDATPFDKIISNPNCSTIQCMLPLKAIQKSGLKEIHFTTFQAVSGSGMKGLNDLKLTTEKNEPQFYEVPIYNNVIPKIDEFLESGYTKEEMKMINETKKILHLNHTEISATCVRVPIENSHSVEILVRLKKKIDVNKIKEELSNFPNIVLIDEKSAKISKTKMENGKLTQGTTIYPYPTLASGTDKVFVGRVRLCPENKKWLHIFCVADNVRKGATSNAIEILEHLVN